MRVCLVSGIRPPKAFIFNNSGFPFFVCVRSAKQLDGLLVLFEAWAPRYSIRCLSFASFPIAESLLADPFFESKG